MPPAVKFMTLSEINLHIERNEVKLKQCDEQRSILLHFLYELKSEKERRENDTNRASANLSV